ncbi:MAG: FAD-dependent oxidoreductase [Candidatus Promineifilaceae bacterium]|nr:FAD-dependent oxidoreductase [Candidatus Promineifilaceae bacterium]
METTDAVIIGSGQGGVPLAQKLAQRGRDVVLFERGSFGGSCVNYGCFPSKAFLASAHAAARARNAAGLGVQAQVDVDFPAVMERVCQIVQSSSDGVEEGLEQADVRTVHAEAAFTDKRTVTGGEVTVQAPLVVLNTGNAPYVPDIPGLAGTPYLTYQNFWELRELPPRFLVLGGGYVGVELGQGMARLGSETHILEIHDRIISHEESRVSETMTTALEKDGVQFHLEIDVSRVDYAEGTFTVRLGNGQTVQGEALLVATGQKPNTEALNAPEAGIDLDDEGYVEVDEHFRTTCSGVYAIGDVTGQPAFTHVSYEDHRRLLSILEGGDRARGDRVQAYAFFTEPEVGRAGLTLKAAKQEGFNARAVTRPLEQVARAYLTGQNRGFYRMVIDSDTDQILGATLVGPDAAELVHVFIAHIEVGSTWQLLEQSVHIHPTFAEGLPTLARRLKENGA